jgi:hypothetical protein
MTGDPAPAGAATGGNSATMLNPPRRCPAPHLPRLPSPRHDGDDDNGRPTDTGAFAAKRGEVVDLTLDEVRGWLVDDVRIAGPGQPAAVVAGCILELTDGTPDRSG